MGVWLPKTTDVSMRLQLLDETRLDQRFFLSHFADFMQSAGAQAELFFWLTVEGYRVTAQQQLEAMHGWQKDGKKHPSATKGLLKAAALGVFEQYLSDKVGIFLGSHLVFNTKLFQLYNRFTCNVF